MQNVIETIQPAINTIVTAVVGVLVTFVLAGLNKLKVKANTWLEARTTVAQREVIHKIAGEGFAFAQTEFKQAGGERKLQEALQYATLRLAEQGITVSAVEIRSAIEKAYLEYKAKTKTVLAEAQPNEDAAQAAAKEAVSSLAAQVTAILSQATGADTMASTESETLQETAPAEKATVTGVGAE